MFRHFFDSVKNPFKKNKSKGSAQDLFQNDQQQQQQPAAPSFLDETQLLEQTFQKSSIVLSSPNRMPNDKHRDGLRNPQQVLRFLGIQPNHRVLDFSSWDGYWATLFVPLTNLPVWCQNVNAWKQYSEPLVQRRLALTDKTQNPNGTNPYGPLRFFNSEYTDPTPPVPPMCADPNCYGCRQEWAGWANMFDLIFTYANYHDPRAELQGTENFGFNQMAYTLLKPGGHLVVIDHAAIDGSGASMSAQLHRIDEVLVVQEVTGVGFELVGTDMSLRDPSDARMTPAWQQNQTPQRTDRFALKFRKPGGEEQEAMALQCMLGHWIGKPPAKMLNAYFESFAAQSGVPIDSLKAGVMLFGENVAFETFILYKGTARFDVTAPMMVLVIKITSFAWSVYDGTRPVKELNDEQQQKAVYVFPSLLEFYGYVFFFGSFLVGPAFDFRDYQLFSSREGPFHHIPSRVVPTLKSLMYALATLSIFMVYSGDWHYGVLVTESFVHMPIWKKLLVIQIVGLVARTKYYSAWKLAEGACNLSGLGYTGPNSLYHPTRNPSVPAHLWSRCENIDILGFELAPNPKLMIDSWNKKTVSWLRHTCYSRLVNPQTGKQLGPWVPLVTYLVSALWHGFHIGYYFTFLCGALFNMVGRSLRRHCRPLFVRPSKWAGYKPVYDFLGWLGTITTINIMVAPFMLWRLDYSLTSWNNVGWYHVVGLVSILVALDGFGLGKSVVRNVLGKKVGAVYAGRVEEGVKLNGGKRMRRDSGVLEVDSEEPEAVGAKKEN
ncbi:Lysophospholipid acyltransferase 1 [Chytridiales sp. JEL 0842]|nr:Lysophospholipid acyltransferase 1 [Chytridiales sp. JEL 0842]